MTEQRQGSADSSQLLQRLSGLETRCRQQQHVIPAAVVKKEEWQGLAFVLDGVRVVAAMDEIKELLYFPSDVTVVPGTKDWMLGLANILIILTMFFS